MSTCMTHVANRLWYLSCLGEARAFRRALSSVADVQEELLLGLLRQNAVTSYGLAHRFGTIRSVAEFQRRVPLTTYEDYGPYVERIAAGEPHVLTAEPVLLLERTSGSTSASKLIPYTGALKAEFNRAIGPWIADLFAHDPRLMQGSAYWSISPVARRGERSSGGIPIGFEEDQEYLGGLQRRLSGAVMAVPAQVKLLSDMDSFRYATLLFLLRRRDLALISVWNPTFLTLLMAPLAGWAEQLAADIERGEISGVKGDADVVRALEALNRPDPGRAGEVRAAFAGAPAAVHARLWPRLRLVSCWTDANAAPFVGEVRALFPQADLQGKGLIATEGFVSLPLTGRTGATLAVRSHFFEFIPEGGGAPILAHQLEPGAVYSVVITTGGGLYRYQLHDLVEVVGPCEVRFVGKEAHVSDRFGEKVNERHVRGALERLFAAAGVAPSFAMVACERWGAAHAYTLFVEGAPFGALHGLAAGLEEALLENFHYKYCRDLGQLGPARVFKVAGGAAAAYLEGCRRRGQRAGDIKPTALHRSDGWGEVFAGGLVE